MKIAGLAMTTLAAFLADPAQAAPSPEKLSFKISSWGKPLFEWTVSRSGLARYTASEKTASGNFHEYDLVTRSFRISEADYHRIETLLKPGRRYAGGQIPCERRITDMPYGRVGWTEQGRTRETRFDLGCLSKEAIPVHRGLEAAQDLMERIAGQGRVIERREVRGPSGG
jgi:hypothetical protein